MSGDKSLGLRVSSSGFGGCRLFCLAPFSGFRAHSGLGFRA